MRLGDRLVVLNRGVMQQVGTPQCLYEHPTNWFVAGFLGSPGMNFLLAQLENNTLRCALGVLRLSDRIRRTLEAARTPREVVIGIRPEHFEDAGLVPPDLKKPGITVTAQVDVLESMGSDKYAYLSLEGLTASAARLRKMAAQLGNVDLFSTDRLITRLSASSTAAEDHTLNVWFDPDQIHIFDPANGRNLTLSPRDGNEDEVQMSRPGGQLKTPFAAGPASITASRTAPTPQEPPAQQFSPDRF
jgi:multiple sugar transport system ATP-binding protein